MVDGGRKTGGVAGNRDVGVPGLAPDPVTVPEDVPVSAVVSADDGPDTGFCSNFHLVVGCTGYTRSSPPAGL